jgi:hypothetical protein
VIREERDPGFWNAVVEHPEVKPHVTLGQDLELSEIVTHPGVVPLAAEHGGFLFVRLDGLGRVYELHTMFTPEGWGREVMLALATACERMFQTGAQLITTYEVEGNWRSRPPKTFRFEPCGDFAEAGSLPARLRTWALSRLDWSTAPARQRV